MFARLDDVSYHRLREVIREISRTQAAIVSAASLIDELRNEAFAIAKRHNTSLGPSDQFEVHTINFDSGVYYSQDDPYVTALIIKKAEQNLGIGADDPDEKVH